MAGRVAAPRHASYLSIGGYRPSLRPSFRLRHRSREGASAPKTGIFHGVRGALQRVIGHERGRRESKVRHRTRQTSLREPLLDGASFVGVSVERDDGVGHARLRDGTVKRSRRSVRRRERVRTVLLRARGGGDGGGQSVAETLVRREHRRLVQRGGAPARVNISRTADESSSGVTPEDDGGEVRSEERRRSSEERRRSSEERRRSSEERRRTFSESVSRSSRRLTFSSPVSRSSSPVSRSSSTASAKENTSDDSASRVFPGQISTVTRVTASPGAGLALVTARAYTNSDAGPVSRVPRDAAPARRA